MHLITSLASCCNTPVDVKATRGRWKGKTAVEVAREKGYSDIVEIISAHKPQPRGETSWLA